MKQMQSAFQFLNILKLWMQFLCSDSTEYYQCSAGKSLLAILEDGTLLPCRRLPIELGNLQEDNLIKIYEESNIISILNGDCTPSDCKSCFQVTKCAGGAKCITYAMTGNMEHRDYNCPYIL